MLIFVTSEYCRLCYKFSQLSKDKVEFLSKPTSIFHIGYMQQEINVAYEAYIKKTSSVWGKFKSVIPFTDAYKARHACANLFDLADIRLYLTKEMWKYRNNQSDINFKKFVVVSAKDEAESYENVLIKQTVHQVDSLENPYVSPLLTKKPAKQEKDDGSQTYQHTNRLLQ